MRTLAILACIFIVMPSGANAQEVPYQIIDAPPGEPLVRDMTFIIPEHNPLEEQVAFPLHAAFFEEADVPFFIERTGRIVPRADPRPAIEDWLGERYVVLICDVPMGDGEILNLNDPQSRKEHCLHWR